MIPEAAPRVLVFLEERFECSNGKTFTRNPGSAGTRWRETLPSAVNAAVVARASRTSAPGGREVNGEVIPLPHYVGVRQTLLSLRRTRRAIREMLDDATVAVVKTPGVIGMLVSIEARAKKIPLVVQVVGDASGVLRSGVVGRILRFGGGVADRLTARVVKRADIVRYVPAASLQQRYPASSGARVHVFSDVVVASEPQWVYPQGAPRIVSVGSADQIYKGQHLLIRALPRIRESIPGATLRLIGGGRMLAELRRTAAEVKVEDHVEFIGYVSDKSELHRLVSNSSLFVLPSLTEGMPRALVEAMALGVPAIASRVGGVPDLLPHSATFEAGDINGMTRLVASLLLDAEGLRALSQAGLSAIRPFDSSARDASLTAWKKDVAALTTWGRASVNDGERDEDRKDQK